jgi:putative phage-type endonuclease
MEQAEQAREAFLAERLLGIGGSDAPVILGLSTWKTPLQLWMEKTGRTADTKESPILRRGRKLEVVVASEYEIETGRKVVTVPGLARHPEHDWMIGHPDRAIEAMQHETPGILEAKAANVFRIREWEDEAPLPAQVQLQHYLAVTGATWGSVAGLLGGIEFKYQDVERNDEFIAALISRERAFWKLVQDDTPPEPQAGDVKVIGKIFAAIEGRSIDLPEEAIEMDRQRLSAKSEIDRLEKLKDEAEAKLKFLIGDAEVGVLPGGIGRYTFKLQKRRAYSVNATEFRELRRSK